MRTKAPRLILQGDTRRAKPWIPWATKWLERLKNVLGDIPINRQNWVVGGDRGVFVHIHSVIGIDTIRIFVRQPVSGCLDAAKFSIDYVNGLTATFSSDEDMCWHHHFWDFGDNQYVFTIGQGIPVVHTYERPGTYNVKLTAYVGRFDEMFPNPIVPNAANLDGAKVISYSFVSNADAYAMHAGEPYIPPATGFSFYKARTHDTFNIWSYRQIRSSFEVKLSEIAGFDSVINQKCFIYLTGNYTSYYSYDPDGSSKPIVKSISGSDMGLTSFESLSTPPTAGITSMIDNTVPMVDSEAGVVDQSDTEPPPILPDPAGHPVWTDGNRWSGWEGRRIEDSPTLIRKLRVKAYTEKKEIIKPVTVA